MMDFVLTTPSAAVRLLPVLLLVAAALPGGAADADPRTERQKQPIKICPDGLMLCIGGEPFPIRGLNYFGFERPWGTMVDGIFHGPTALSIDFVNVMRRMKLLGFNAIRLPFNMDVLFDVPPKDYETWCPYYENRFQNPLPYDIMKSVTRPGLNITEDVLKNTSVLLPYEPDGTLPPDGSVGFCNSYLPRKSEGASTLDRFIWVMSFLARNGFVVIPVDQLQFDDAVLLRRDQWGKRWSTIIRRVRDDPWARTRVIFDIMNEPDAQLMHWQAYNNATGFWRPSIGEVYHEVMKEGYKINPDALYMLEGAGQVDLGLSWGDGFSTSRLLLDTGEISDPTAFYQSLVGPNAPPYANNTIIAPHVYPSSVIPRGCTGKSLCNRLSNSWGHLQLNGFCHQGHCRRFPVLIGELGSRLRDCRNPCSNRKPNCMEHELQTMAEISQYLADGDYWHAPVAGWLWWSWNPNSVDTGGVVEDDWATVIWEKIDYLTTIGLRPWYSARCPGGHCEVAPLDTSPLRGCRDCTSERQQVHELVKSDQMPMPFGRDPFQQAEACPSTTDLTCCYQPKLCIGNCDSDAACPAPLVPKRPELPPIDLSASEPLPHIRQTADATAAHSSVQNSIICIASALLAGQLLLAAVD